MLDYTISAQKYPKIVTQEKEKIKESPTVVLKLCLFLWSLDVVFQMFRCINQTSHHDTNVAGIKLEKEMWC